MKRITGICFNWHFSPTDNCQNFDNYHVGHNDVIAIEYCPDYGGPAHYVVVFKGGKEQWVYNVNQVYLDPVEQSTTNPEAPSHLAQPDLPF